MLTDPSTAFTNVHFAQDDREEEAVILNEVKDLDHNSGTLLLAIIVTLFFRDSSAFGLRMTEGGLSS